MEHKVAIDDIVYSGHYAKLAVYNDRIRESGIEAFLAEQQKLVDKGLSFPDLV